MQKLLRIFAEAARGLIFVTFTLVGGVDSLLPDAFTLIMGTLSA